MIHSTDCTRNDVETKDEFLLFKPLLLIAMAVFCFELLPIDFQHAIAPRLVSYDEVFNADPRRPTDTVSIDDEMTVKDYRLKGVPYNPAILTLSN